MMTLTEDAVVAIGLLLVAAMAVVALGGIFANTGNGHQLNHAVNILGYHLHGSTGKLFLVGIVVGAVGILGLMMLLAGIGVGFKRRTRNRQERTLSRRQTRAAMNDRDRLAGQLEQEHAARIRAEKSTLSAERASHTGTGENAPATIDTAEQAAAEDGRTGLLHRRNRL